MRLISQLARKAKFGGTSNGWNNPKIWDPAHFINLGGSGLANNTEWLEHNFDEYVQKLYKDNGVVFACIQTRMLVFSEARLMFQEIEKDGRPGDLVHHPRLRLFEHPWPGADTGDMLTIMEADASLAGNAYFTLTDDHGNFGKRAANHVSTRIVRLRPNFVELIIHSRSGNPWALDARVVGYRYRPFLQGRADDSVILLPEEVAHYKPIPDPEARFRGMSWLTPVIREVGSDRSAESHKKKFFDQGATLGHIVSFADSVSPEDFDEFVTRFQASHSGFENAYKTLFLGGGADVTTVGVDLKQLEFTMSQGHGETRIAAASGVPPVIVGLSEGLQAATYSNYGQARRRFADGTLRPLWRMACSSLSRLIEVPAKQRLWYDDRDIAFCREDQADQADIDSKNAQTAKAYVEAGFKPDSVVKALAAHDVDLLEHTGLVSVQLLPPGLVQPMAGTPGNGQPGPNGQGGQPKNPSDGSKPSPRKDLQDDGE